jgi:mono/diheme cytochrome c family protein
MTRQIRIAAAAWILVTGAAVFHASVLAQGKSVADGVYSEAQAKRGSTLYSEQCASCHGDDLSGVADLFPALKGDVFVNNWQGKPVAELFDKIAMTMPALDPGSLKPEQTADLLADLLSASKYPAGSADLEASAEALKQIQFVAPQP